MKLDSALIRALNLDTSRTQVKSHGGSSFASTAKIVTILNDGTEKQYFMKTGQGEDKATMFEGEHASLNAIHTVVPTLCPASLAFGRMEDSASTYFLVTDFLDMSSGIGLGARSEQTLAQKLAKLHTTPAPIPEGWSKRVFGFPVITCCGDTAQKNDYKESWAQFYAENRLLAILKKSEESNGKDDELCNLVKKTTQFIVPRLLGDDHLNGGKGVTPVVVHGDLWSGNKGKAKIAGKGSVEDVVFDPSACWAHNEYELGIMQMFGGFHFLEEYHKSCPQTEPVDEYKDRVSLYEL